MNSKAPTPGMIASDTQWIDALLDENKRMFEELQQVEVYRAQANALFEGDTFGEDNPVVDTQPDSQHGVL